MRTLHVGLRVEDLQRSLAFYTTLGYDVVGTVPDTAFGSLTMLKLPNDEFVGVELVHEPAACAVDPRGLNHLVVQVEDLHGAVADLAAHAIRADAPTSPDGSDDLWAAWLTDPGYRIELVQWPSGHADGLTSADFAQQEPPGDHDLNNVHETSIAVGKDITGAIAVRSAVIERVESRVRFGSVQFVLKRLPNLRRIKCPTSLDREVGSVRVGASSPLALVGTLPNEERQRAPWSWLLAVPAPPRIHHLGSVQPAPSFEELQGSGHGQIISRP